MKWTDVPKNRFKTASIKYIFEHYDDNGAAGCFYHNWNHIVDGFKWMEENNIPFDINLMYAWLYHDIIYDAEPNKEARSLKEFVYFYDLGSVPKEVSKDRVCELIMLTAHHDVQSCEDQIMEAMIKADLHGLTHPLSATENFVLIHRESQQLYGKSSKECAWGTVEFMKSFAQTMRENYEFTRDEFWEKALIGCRLTHRLAHDIATWKYDAINS